CREADAPLTERATSCGIQDGRGQVMAQGGAVYGAGPGAERGRWPARCGSRRTGRPRTLIVDLHGWGLAKTGGPQTPRVRARYVVVSYTARGFGNPAGLPRRAPPTPRCAIRT